MSKVLRFAIFILLTAALAGCNLPGQEAEPTADLVATQVAKLLTESATEASPLPTETQAPPTATPTPEGPTPTTTATLTPTLDQTDPAQQLGSPAWTQDFSSSSSAWDFDYPQATFSTANGYLNLVTKANANWHSWYVSSPKLKNAYVEATIQMANCSGQDRFGLAVRASSDGQQFYYMGLTCDGQWGFFRMHSDNGNINIDEIKAYQSAEPLNNGTDKPHRVGIWMKDSSFTFYIDGQQVGTASDATLSGEGYTGFLIAYSSSPGFTTRVDELKYWNVP